MLVLHKHQELDLLHSFQEHVFADPIAGRDIVPCVV